MRKLNSRTQDRSALSSQSSIERRRFIAVLGAALAATACGRSPQSILEGNSQIGRRDPLGLVPVQTNGSVRDFGAIGDGATNDTTAINAALKSLGESGGMIEVPDGVYLVDPDVSIQIPSNTTLALGKNAVLRAIPTRAQGSSVVLIDAADNVNIVGGKVIGERDGHLGTGGEWGMGIKVVGSSNVRLDGIEISNCWGDGIYVGASGVGRESQNVTVSNCVARNNRRQGISLTGCVGALIEDSQFTDTNGTAPSAGIDLEPNAGLRVSDVVIHHCLVARNAGYGVLLVGNEVSNVRVELNRCVDNGGAGVHLMRGVNGTTITKNWIARNATNGVLFEGANYNELSNNVIRDNSVNGRNGFSNVLLTAASSSNTISDNQFGLSRLLNAGMPDIVITPDCSDNVIHTTGQRSRRQG